MIHSIGIEAVQDTVVITCSCGWSTRFEAGTTLHAVEREAHAHAFPISAGA
jgi:RNase P subunit RPR2